MFIILGLVLVFCCLIVIVEVFVLLMLISVWLRYVWISSVVIVRWYVFLLWLV